MEWKPNRKSTHTNHGFRKLRHRTQHRTQSRTVWKKNSSDSEIRMHKISLSIETIALFILCSLANYTFTRLKKERENYCTKGKQFRCTHRRKRENMTRYIINFVLQLLMMRVQCLPFYESNGLHKQQFIEK